MKDNDQCTRRARPTLTSPTCMRKAFRRGRLPPCRTAVGRIVDSIQLMVGRDTVTNTCCDKGRFRGEPSFVSVELSSNCARAAEARGLGPALVKSPKSARDSLWERGAACALDCLVGRRKFVGSIPSTGKA